MLCCVIDRSAVDVSLYVILLRIPRSFDRPSSFRQTPRSGLQVRTFVKNEDQNFSLFNYVNEQQNEVEKLEEQLHQLEEEEKKFTQVLQTEPMSRQ